MTTRTQDHADQITSRARVAYRASYDATKDHGCALAAANEAIAEFLAIFDSTATGTFDAETLIWMFDE